MSEEFTKSYAINRIAELNEQIVEMTDNQNQTMRYLNRIRDENTQLKQQLAEKDEEIEHLKINYFNLVRNIDKFADNQLALQELEKVKILIQNAINFVRPNFVEVYDAINKQIKELKGEKV